MESKEFIVKVGAKIEAEREKKGLTREEFADLVKVSRMQVYRIETGKTNPSLGILYDMSIILEIELIYLLDIS